MRIKFFMPVAALTFSTATLFAQAPQTLTGKVTGSMCGAHHMMKNFTPAQYTRKCLTQGYDLMRSPVATRSMR